MRPLSRRAFVALAAAFAAPQWALGQTARRIYRLAWLGTIDGSKEPYSLALVQRQRELGFADGNNLQITSRHAGGRIKRLPSLAAELVKSNPDVLFGSGLEANLVALTQAGGDIPIVFIAVDFDPIATGHVVNPARPGGRLTGLTAVQSVLPGERLELVKELLPATRKVAVLGNDQTVGQLAVTEEAPNGWRWSCTSFSSSALHSTTKPRLEKRRRRARKSSSYADPRSSCRRDDSFPSSPSRPACRVCSNHAQWAGVGGLMSYGFNFPQMWRSAADMVAKMLRGTKAGDIPMEQPTTYELAINAATARKLGTRIPESIRIRVDRVIDH